MLLMERPDGQQRREGRVQPEMSVEIERGVAAAAARSGNGDRRAQAAVHVVAVGDHAC